MKHFLLVLDLNKLLYIKCEKMAKRKDTLDGNAYWSGRKLYRILQDDNVRFILINLNILPPFIIQYLAL